MNRLERARASDQRVERILRLLCAGAKFSRTGATVGMDSEMVCLDSFQELANPGENEVFEDLVLDGGSLGKEFVSPREFDMGEEVFSQVLKLRPSAESQARLEAEWHKRALAAAELVQKTTGDGKVMSLFRHGVCYEDRIFLAGVPQLREWAQNKEAELRRRGRIFPKPTYV